MLDFHHLLSVNNSPVANPKAIVQHKNVRFTVLTARIMRLECSSTGKFEDRSSQIILNRTLPVIQFTLKESEEILEIVTEFLHLKYHKLSDNFTSTNLSITILHNKSKWHYGDTDLTNLKGTARTLDMADGAISLEDGLISRSGWALIDDSDSLVFNEHGWLEERKTSGEDLYFLGFGHNYQDCLKEYCLIAGKVPMIPRWILGNWWSRYWEYTQESLQLLMEKFEFHDIPLSVCIVDMDWHIVNIQEYLKEHSTEDWQNAKFHEGWTGFTWNEEFFPDYPSFLQSLHDKHLRIALNLHPASGIASHECQYKRVAEALEIDVKLKHIIPFKLRINNLLKPISIKLSVPMKKRGLIFGGWIGNKKKQPLLQD